MEQITLRVQTHHLASGTESRVDGEHSFLSEWSRHEQLFQVADKDAYRFLVCKFLRQIGKLRFYRRLEETFEGVGNSIGNIMFKPEILCKAGQKLLKLIPSGVFRIFTENNFDQLLAMLAGMERELTEKTEGYRCYTGAVMQFFLTSIYRRINDMPDMAGIGGNDEMEIILDYIREHYQGKISLQLLGELIGRSAVYTGKLFHQVTRCCFSKYLLRYRLGKAQELLRNSRLTITEIAYHTGFFDSSHFTRSFEKNCGMLPLAYRRKYRGNLVP
jgi:AraC-like DNA-binding protein